MSALPFKAIAAMSLNRAIGNGNTIPWHLPEDFKWFKETTMGHVLAMGRKTFESIGRPLPGRETVVLTRNPGFVTGVRTLGSLEELGQVEAYRDRTIFICGGAEIYSQALCQCSDLFLTRVKRKVEGDAFSRSSSRCSTPASCCVKRTSSIFFTTAGLAKRPQRQAAIDLAPANG